MDSDRGCLHRRHCESPRGGIAEDSDGLRNAGDVAVQRDLTCPSELPWTAQGMCSSLTQTITGCWNCRGRATGYGPQTTLPTSGLLAPFVVAVDSVGECVHRRHRGMAIRWWNCRRVSVNFEGVNVCAPGQTTPAPCSKTLTLNFNVNAERNAWHSKGAHRRRAEPRLHPGQRKHLHRRVFGGRNLHGECDLCASGREGYGTAPLR